MDNQILKYSLFSRIKLLIQKKIYIRSFSRSDALIFLSNFSKKILNKNINLKKKKTIIIPHGVSDIFEFKKKNLNKNLIKIIYVSKIDIYKNQYKVIMAIKELKDKLNIHLTLVGAYDHKYRKILMKLIRESKITKQVKILGKVKYKNLPKLYNEHDIKVYASKSETFGMTMLEAMKCGLPILATKNQISTEILKEAGFFCENTTNGIKIGILKIINDKKKLQSKINLGIKISKKFKWKTTSENTFNFLQSMGSK